MYYLWWLPCIYESFESVVVVILIINLSSNFIPSTFTLCHTLFFFSSHLAPFHLLLLLPLFTKNENKMIDCWMIQIYQLLFSRKKNRIKHILFISKNITSIIIFLTKETKIRACFLWNAYFDVISFIIQHLYYLRTNLTITTFRFWFRKNIYLGFLMKEFDYAS